VAGMAVCLWFDDQAGPAADFYTSIFPNSRIARVTRYGDAGPRPTGMVMSVSFVLDGREFVALNGPRFQFSPAVSLLVKCRTQAEVDHFWARLGDGGQPQQCGWLQDRYGVTWQIAPTVLDEMLADPDPDRARRVMRAMLRMRKPDIAALERACR